MRIGRSSTSPQPRADDGLGQLAADVAAALALDLEADVAVGDVDCGVTRVTPGTA